MKLVQTSVFRSCAFALLLSLSACRAPALHTVERTQVLMDTAITLKIFLPERSNATHAAAEIDAVFAELTRLDSLFSSYRATSEVSTINRLGSEQETQISSELDSLIAAAQAISAATAGAFDITIAPLLRAWGFGTDTLDVPSADEITSRLPLVNFRNLKLRQNTTPQTLTSTTANTTFMSFAQPGMAIDLGGIAKGYAADIAARRLARAGFRDMLVAVGGDLHLQATTLTAGQRYIWIKHPRRPEVFFARFRGERGGVSTSGDYERYFERDGKRYHHIINPATGFPAGENAGGAQTVSVTVLAENTISSDAFATAFFVIGLEPGLALAERLPEIEAVFVFIADGKLQWRATSGLAQKLEIINTEL